MYVPTRCDVDNPVARCIPISCLSPESHAIRTNAASLIRRPPSESPIPTLSSSPDSEKDSEMANKKNFDKASEFTFLLLEQSHISHWCTEEIADFLAQTKTLLGKGITLSGISMSTSHFQCKVVSFEAQKVSVCHYTVML